MHAARGGNFPVSFPETNGNENGIIRQLRLLTENKTQHELHFEAFSNRRHRQQKVTLHPWSSSFGLHLLRPSGLDNFAERMSRSSLKVAFCFLFHGLFLSCSGYHLPQQWRTRAAPMQQSDSDFMGDIARDRVTIKSLEKLSPEQKELDKFSAPSNFEVDCLFVFSTTTRWIFPPEYCSCSFIYCLLRLDVYLLHCAIDNDGSHRHGTK